VVIYNGNEHDEYGDIIEDSFHAKAMQEKRMTKLHYLKEDSIPPKLIGSEKAKILLSAGVQPFTPYLKLLKD